MNKDITIMIDLQRFWDNVVHGREEIEKSTKAIHYWLDRVRDFEHKSSSLSTEIMKLRNSIKQNEIDLGEKDAKAKKLDERKLMVTSEKELGALDHEILALNGERGNLEDELLRLFDVLEAKNEEMSVLSGELKEASIQSEKDIAMLKDRIERFTGIIEENKRLFEERISELSPSVQSRFQKLIASNNGKGVARVTGDTCGACNFQIPAHLASDASRDDKILICTNCGRFIYK